MSTVSSASVALAVAGAAVSATTSEALSVVAALLLPLPPGAYTSLYGKSSASESEATYQPLAVVSSEASPVMYSANAISMPLLPASGAAPLLAYAPLLDAPDSVGSSVSSLLLSLLSLLDDV